MPSGSATTVAVSYAAAPRGSVKSTFFATPEPSPELLGRIEDVNGATSLLGWAKSTLV
jgi:hypothetical protein